MTQRDRSEPAELCKPECERRTSDGSPDSTPASQSRSQTRSDRAGINMCLFDRSAVRDLH